eukprot:3854103-Rhodomonas_salina.1
MSRALHPPRTPASIPAPSALMLVPFSSGTAKLLHAPSAPVSLRTPLSPRLFSLSRRFASQPPMQRTLASRSAPSTPIWLKPRSRVLSEEHWRDIHTSFSAP